jgi:hypothetical protein
MAGCVGTQLTATELQKCLTNGIGGNDGCFGENNTAVKFVTNAFNDITKSPGPFSVAHSAGVFQTMIFRSYERALRLPRKRRALTDVIRTTSARPSGQAEAFEPAGRGSFAPFAVRDHHRAG